MNDPNLPEPLPSAWRALLLHRLPDEQAQALEQRLLAEPPLLDALREAEHDLYDDYAQGRLMSEEHRAFEEHVLTTPEACERLRFGHALGVLGSHFKRDSQIKNLSQLESPSLQPLSRRERGFTAPHHRRRVWIALAGGALAASLAVALVVLRPPVPPPGATQTTVSAPPQTLVLLASVERGAQSAAVELALTKDTTQVRVQAEIEQPDATAHYRLSVLAEDGSAAPMQRIENLALVSAGRYRYVEALLPSKLFADGAKTLRVEAQPPAPAFSFEWTVRAAPADPG